MKKTPTIFLRNPDNMRFVTDTPNPDAQWVFDGLGVPTRKYDGTACLVKKNKLYKRYELRPGKTPPKGFIPAQNPDPNTNKQPGWVPTGEGPEDKWHREAFESGNFADGTYELVGPKVQGNRDWFLTHTLVAHKQAERLPNIEPPITVEKVSEYLKNRPDIEGIVWHHTDGRWAKIKRRDFGFKW